MKKVIYDKKTKIIKRVEDINIFKSIGENEASLIVDDSVQVDVDTDVLKTVGDRIVGFLDKESAKKYREYLNSINNADVIFLTEV